MAPATELDEGAKDRLARREAATRLLEKSVLEPAPPKAPEPPPAAKVPAGGHIRTGLGRTAQAGCRRRHTRGSGAEGRTVDMEIAFRR